MFDRWTRPALALGAREFVSKPTELDEFTPAVRMIVEKRTMPDASNRVNQRRLAHGIGPIIPDNRPVRPAALLGITDSNVQRL